MNEWVGIFITALPALSKNLKQLECLSKVCYLGSMKYYAYAKKNSRFLSTYIWFGLPWWLSGKESTFQCRMWIWSLGQDALEKEMVNHSSLLAWENPWTEEPGHTEGWGHKRVRDDLVTEQQWFGLYREMGR